MGNSHDVIQNEMVNQHAVPVQPQAGLIYIEQLSVCPNSTIQMLGKNDVQKLAVLFRPRCKRWDCPHCCFVNKSLWTMRMHHATSELIQNGQSLSMVTITAHEKHQKNRAIQKFPDQWNKLQNRWRRRCAGRPYYALFPEVGHGDHFHCHFITNEPLTERFWKDNARASGMGFMADGGDANIPPQAAAGYASKYLTKSFQFQWPKGFRRVRTSQNFPKLPTLQRHPDWFFSVLAGADSLQAVRDKLQAQGYRVALSSHKAAWALIETGELTG